MTWIRIELILGVLLSYTSGGGTYGLASTLLDDSSRNFALQLYSLLEFFFFFFFLWTMFGPWFELELTNLQLISTHMAQKHLYFFEQKIFSLNVVADNIK